MARTLKQISELVTPSAPNILIDAERLWRETEQDKRNFWDKSLTTLTPLFLVALWLTFFLLSANHTQQVVTATNADAIAFFSPLGLEIGVFILAVLRTQGISTRTLRILLVSLIIYNMVVNVLGGFSTASETADSGVRYITQVGLSIPLGIIISFGNAVIGDLLVRWVRGDTDITRDVIADRWETEKWAVYQKALYDAVLRLGDVTMTNASKWAYRYVHMLQETERKNAENDAISELPGTSKTSKRKKCRNGVFPCKGYFEPSKHLYAGRKRWKHTGNWKTY